MRDRPFITAGEAPRPFGDVLAERGGFDATERVLADIKQLEGAAAEASDPAERKRLQCEAEALRCALAERPPRRA